MGSPYTDSRPNLNATFAAGWAKLPDEIKLHVLSYSNLVTPYGRLDTDAFDEKGMSTTVDNYIAHCLMGPDFARLATEIFYSGNTFMLTQLLHEVAIPLISKRTYHHLIRRLFLRFCYGMRTGRSHWRSLRKLAEGGYGFAALKWIEVV
ncbi:hypothetical protein K458DRAFT_425299 [Lentithecium fluviatile CBS 122367]|uniref:Uncharacterized protein n=1 Tax=Lentithecium fluviatile CBS 122367 TaxID=1168545 RepID=A0A6G1IC69_9PLEO|nr:hypothetical protein K458DRAFT_425299 [Lentithecium fluviatile CBS 122367]